MPGYAAGEAADWWCVVTSASVSTKRAARQAIYSEREKNQHEQGNARVGQGGYFRYNLRD